VGNCTYALPYAHESTHGVLLSLGLVSVAHRWIAKPGARRSFVLGLLSGLSIVLKPEFMLLSALVVGCAVLLRVRSKRPTTATEITWAGMALVIPMALFTLYFWCSLPLAAAFRAANQAWWSVLVSHVHAQVWASFLGADAPLHNLGSITVAGGILALSVGTMWLGAERASRGSRLAILLVPIPCGLALAGADWLKAAFCVPLGLLAVLAVRIAKAIRRQDAESPLRLLLAAGALALFIRMSLYPRFFHFGFYQAALATMVVLAETLVLLGSAAGQHKMTRLVVRASTGLVIASACLGIFLSSRALLSLRTFPVGTGRDRFLTFAPKQDTSGFLVEKMVDALRLQPDASRVLVVPEGLMINYLARRHSPLPEWIFIDLTLAGSAEAALVDRLRADAPEFVVLISRDLREHGITHFGAEGQPGQRLIAFFHQRYRPILQLGGDPFTSKLKGAQLLRRAF